MKRAAGLMLAALLGACSAPEPPVPPPTPAQSAAAKAALEQAGLMGVWSPDCSAAAANAEWEHLFVDGRGVPQTTLRAGNDRAVFNIVEARRLSPTDLETTVVSTGGFIPAGERMITVYRVEANRQMTWASRTSAGEKLVIDGVMPSGNPSKWYNRCPEGTPAP